MSGAIGFEKSAIEQVNVHCVSRNTVQSPRRCHYVYHTPHAFWKAREAEQQETLWRIARLAVAQFVRHLQRSPFLGREDSHRGGCIPEARPLQRGVQD